MAIETYQEKIDRLISESSGEVVLNGSHEHAAIIIERMFARAQKSVKILTRKFDPRIYCAPKTIEAARQMLGDKSRTIQILIEEIDATNHEGSPYFEEFLSLGNIEIKSVHEKLRKPINVNFALMDDCGYRFEKDQDGATAFVAFGEKSLFPRLNELFDSVWVRSNQPVLA